MDFVKNQVITLEITDISHEGEGIGKVDGFTFFVKDTIPGDHVTAKVMKTKKTYGYARLEQIITIKYTTISCASAAWKLRCWNAPWNL